MTLDHSVMMNWFTAATKTLDHAAATVTLDITVVFTITFTALLTSCII
jgi:hypothetical protein